MLIQCPECELQVSDKAYSCPHCGLPMKETKKPRPSNKHKRLPNGFGQITFINKANLRNPYRAMVTVGKNSVGKPISKVLKPQGYFKTYNEAYAALMEYNKNPYDLDADMTVKELYDEWSKKYFENIKSSSTRTITSAWAYCTSVYDLRAKDIRPKHIKYCMEYGEYDKKTPSANTKSRIKSMFNLMLDYALEHELVDKNYARDFDLSDEDIKEITKNKKDHISFTEEEMTKLWNNKDLPYVNIILFQCYSGWRPQELGLIELSDVDLDKNIITGGMKTEAGMDRPVPIHPKIKCIVKDLYNQAIELNSKYLINCTDARDDIFMSYDKYSKRFKKVITLLELNPEHRPHDPRKQFTTMAKEANLNEYAIKYIIGHKIKDLTESTYTDRNVNWLIEQVNMIP